MSDFLNSLMGLFGGNQNVPAFTSSGGVTPEQGVLGEFLGNEGVLGQTNLFASAGEPISTMATQAAGGARNAAAKAITGMSDANQAAQFDLYKNQIADAQTTQAQTGQTLDELAQVAGLGFGA